MAMMLMLLDEPLLEVFDSPERPPSWIEAVDIENGEYQFCDENGQRYVGVITGPRRWFQDAKFQLRPEGVPDIKNALALVERAKAIKPNDRFPDLDSLRRHFSSR